MNPQPDIALGRPGIFARLTAVGDLVQVTKSGPLALSSVIGHVVTFCSLPLILRIYGPEAFGEYSLILSIGYVLLVVATLKLEVVIPTMQHVSLAARLTSALFVLSLLVGIAVFPVGLATYVLTGWKPGHAIAAVPVYGTIAAFVCLLSSFLIMRNWLVRIQALFGVTLMQIVRPVGFVVLAIAFGYIWPETAPSNGLALLSATAIALLLAVVLGYAQVPKRLRRFIWPTRWHRSLQEVRANTSFLSALSTSQILDLISLQVPLWFTAALYGATPAGWIALAGRIVFLPAMIVGSSLGPVLNRRVSEAYYSKKRLAEQISAFLMALGLIGAIGFSLIAILAPWFTDMVFGGKWAGAAPTLRVYCFYGFAYFLSATTAFIPILLREKVYLVALNAIRLAGLCGAALFAFFSDLGFEAFIFVLAAVEVCTYLFSVAFTVHIMHRHDAAMIQSGA